MSLCVLGKHHRQLGSTLLDLIKVSAKGRERFSLTFPAWHLPKVLILQSASARAGADRTFSDQYLGQVPEGQQVKKRDRSQGLLRLVFLSCWLRVRPRGWYTVHGNVDHVSAVCNWSVSGMKKRIQRPQKSSWLGYSALTRATRVRVPVAEFCHCVSWENTIANWVQLCWTSSRSVPRGASVSP